MPARRFPPPWSVEEQDASFVLVDHSGQKLAHICFEEETRPAISRQAAHQRRGETHCRQRGKVTGAVA
jgi:hypothetical protein